jgi:hypothetical protein
MLPFKRDRGGFIKEKREREREKKKEEEEGERR